MERKKERKKERKTPEANEKMSCLRWDLNPRHSALQTDAHVHVHVQLVVTYVTQTYINIH